MFSEPFRPATHHVTHILKSWPISQLVGIKASQRLHEIVILWVYYTIPFGFTLFRHIWVIIFNFWNHFLWFRITDEGSLPEMGTWSILLIKSDLKWRIQLSRSLFLYIHTWMNGNGAQWICTSSAKLTPFHQRPLQMEKRLQTLSYVEKEMTAPCQ